MDEAVIKLLESVNTQLAALAVQVADVRERVIRLESQGANERLIEMTAKYDNLRDRVTIMETQGRFFTAGVAAGVSVLVSVLATFVAYFMKSGHGN
jgi:hypothetical protein